jgi:hypothetical protein
MTRNSDENGGALAIAVLLLAGLTALGVVFMTTARTETQIAGNDMRITQSLYAAEAGLNEAMARLDDASSGTYVGENMQAPNQGWGVYIVTSSGNSARDPERADTAEDGLDNDIDGSIDESEETYPEVLSVQSVFSSQINYPWVRLSYCLDASNNILRYGDHDDNPTTVPRKNTARGAPIVVVDSRGERGLARKTLEVELVKTPSPYVKSCVYTEDDNFKFNGQSFLISGYDHDPASGDSIPGNPGVDAIVTTMDPGVILGALNSNQLDQVIGPEGEGSVDGTPYDLDLEAYVDHYSQYADFTYVGETSNPDVTGWGGMNDFHIVCVKNGDLHLSGVCTGGGLLLIDGSLLITGQFTWYGLIITLGDIDFGGGGNGVHIYGGILSSGNVTRNDIGGEADILYCSQMLRKLDELERYKILSWTEK